MKRLIKALSAALLLLPLSLQADKTLLNVSYDPTREFYKEYNELFAKHWLAKTGEALQFNQSHGGSGKQARSVIDGLPADVVTLALALDIDSIADKAKLLPANWQTKLKDHSSPYTSVIVFLVRKGNPKHIKDWDDLVKPGVTLVSPNPKTGGAPRWIYLSAWGYAQKKKHLDEAGAKAFVAQFYKNTPVLDSGARGSTTTFMERGIGDVLVTWENEAYQAQSKAPQGDFEVITPSISILAEPSVAVVEKNAAKHGTLAEAKAYLEYLYSPEAQDLIGKFHFRPRDKAALAKYADQFPAIETFTIDEAFGGWAKAQKKHFDDGGVYDSFYLK
jgi:sulfate/thiosulfate-binding protein